MVGVGARNSEQTTEGSPHPTNPKRVGPFHQRNPHRGRPALSPSKKTQTLKNVNGTGQLP
ncbi:hypothetical protein CHELA1G2_13124 [Hyphomicrobiales bacterium]|nr:hypothetical protein CHELA1G2_13124 [Hyphomicrobiales bacterium]